MTGDPTPIDAKSHFYATGEKYLREAIAASEPVSFTCHFAIVSKARPRFGKGRTWTPKKTSRFEALVAFEARKAMAWRRPITSPCKLEIYALHAVPASWPKWKKAAAMGRPYTSLSDADNQIKAVSDALNGIVYDDDRQVSHVSIERRYSDRDQFRVTVTPLEGVPVKRQAPTMTPEEYVEQYFFDGSAAEEGQA